MSSLGVLVLMVAGLGLMPPSGTGLIRDGLEIDSRDDIDEDWLSELCQEFEHIPYSLMRPGNVLRPEPSAVSAAECCQSCLDVEDFVCTSALVQYPNICFLTGYRLRNDGTSTHYSRTCQSGTSCFSAIADMSAGFNDVVVVPKSYQVSNKQASFCMNVCSRTPKCIGFDSYDGDCAFFNMRLSYNASNFATYLRKCWTD